MTFIYLFLFILFIYSYLFLFILIYSYLFLFVFLFIYLSIYLFIYLFIHSFIYLFIFIRLFIYSYLLIYLFIYLFTTYIYIHIQYLVKKKCWLCQSKIGVPNSRNSPRASSNLTQRFAELGRRGLFGWDRTGIEGGGYIPLYKYCFKLGYMLYCYIWVCLKIVYP